MVGDGEEQVGLPQPDAPIDEDGVVGLRGRRFGHREGCGVSELVAGAGHEGLECVPLREGKSQGLIQGGLVECALGELGLSRIWLRLAGGRCGIEPEPNACLRTKHLSNGRRDEVHVVAGEPALHIPVGGDQVEDVAVQLTRGEVDEPELERSFGEVTPGPIQHCVMGSLGRPCGRLIQRPVSKRRRHYPQALSTGVGNGAPARGEGASRGPLKRGGL